MTDVVTTRKALAGARADLPGRVALVPTMGALHEGHLSLLRSAHQLADTVVASIFVNPLQFGPHEDLHRYPRPREADLRACEQEGVALVFAPEVDEMYPGGQPQVTIDPGPLGEELEGAVRPGHFAGVLTVVAKLFGLVHPDVALFGEKDYQQLVLIRRMVADLELGVQVVGAPTIREPDGLALSSRNAYLDHDQRLLALTLSRALRAGRDAAPLGAEAVLAKARATLAAVPELTEDYLALRDPDLGPAPAAPTVGEARLLIAAKVGPTRLIDNMPLVLGM
jgi:pantoate--beta-alanine ligase